ncbi:MAG: biotin-independent malonate decarboxylase subunit gamma [Bryobacteraceae bacterium]
MSDQREIGSRGHEWFQLLVGCVQSLSHPKTSVISADASLNDEQVRYLAVIPNPESRFPRARRGEIGVEEGWTLAKCIREVIELDKNATKRPIISIVDVPSQAYGRREEALGIFLACAAAVDAYATARLAGHPVISLIVGHALSGAFLAHGYQANRILALDAPETVVHAMGKGAAARITSRSIADLNRLADCLIPVSYDIRDYAKLGLLYKLIGGVNAGDPAVSDVQTVRQELLKAIADTRTGTRDLSNRLDSPEARENRIASIEVRNRLLEQWAATAETPNGHHCS